MSKLAELVGADKDNSYGFQTVGGEPSSRPLKTLKAEYEEDFYVPAFGRDNRNGGFR